jgi:dipeptidase
VLIAGVVGVAGPQNTQRGSVSPTSQADVLDGKKLCGWPPPEGVPEELWANACEACTSVPVSPETSSDGTLTSHSCDGGYEIRISVVPGATHPPGTMRAVMAGGGLGEEKPPNRQERKVGEIPQVEKTFTRYNASYPFMNEKGVIIGETTIGGRRELYSDEGLFDIMELERLALERASTAREAIQIMGEFAEKHGYIDSGECLTVGDAKEVWQFEIFGPGATNTGAVWAAKRIPPGEVGVSANRPRITTLDEDPNTSMFSKNVYEVAERNGWWKKGEPFIFAHAFGGKPTSPNRREWRVFNLLAPSLKLDPWAPEQPFSVKPDRKVTVRDVMRIHRDVYEGTPFDQTTNPLAGPMGSPNRWSMPRDFRMAQGYAAMERMIAVHQCSYVTVLQARASMPAWIGTLVWFAPDDAKTSVFSPLYAGNLKVPHAFEIGRRDRLDRSSAYWASNFVGNFANVNYQGMIQDIRAKQVQIEDALFAAQPVVEKTALELYAKDPAQARVFINDYSNRVAQENFTRWWELADQLVVDYQDGGSRVSDAAKRSYPKAWLDKQGPFGTKLPTPPTPPTPAVK